MGTQVTLKSHSLKEIRQIDPRLVSYNIEMTEVTGGTFWKAYTPEQVAGTEEVPPIRNIEERAALMQYYEPIDAKSEKLRYLAGELGSAWVRVSGTWASKTYYDFDGTANGVSPEGYDNLMTKEQWLNLLDFVKAVDGKLLISVANCEGLHKASEPWNASQAEQIFALSKEYGVPISAVEFMNEPNILATSGAPIGYTPADFARDQDIFHAWVRANYPETLIVGPCSTGDPGSDNKQSGGIAAIMNSCTTEELMQGTKEKLDIYSYHCYNGISERLASIMPDMHWNPDRTLSENYLAVVPGTAQNMIADREKYCPGAQMWVTEAGDAGGGGNTWASTFMDVFRTLNELGSFPTITDGVIFHNTLASSDYGFLEHGTFEPRPNYFAVLLWTKLMGTTVYDSEEPWREGAHVYAHSRKDQKEGAAYLVINNSKTDITTVTLPKDAEYYVLSAKTLRSPIMMLNDKPLMLKEDGSLPEMTPQKTTAKTLELAPATCTFIIL